MKNKPSNGKQVIRVTAIGMAWNMVLCGFKISAGVIGNSQAVLADGFHSLSDIGTDLAIIIGAKIWEEPADQEHPYGHGRLENVVSLGIALLLAGVGAALLWSAVWTWRSGEASPPPRWIAAIAAAFSLVVKEYLYHWTLKKGIRINSSALRANAWHHRSDALSSIPALIAVVGAIIFPDLYWLDTIGGILVSTLILYAACKIGGGALQSLIDRGASVDDIRRIHELATQVKGVKYVHAIRTRSIGQGWIVDLHLEVDKNITVAEGHNIAERVHQQLISKGPAIADTIIHVEPAEQMGITK